MKKKKMLLWSLAVVVLAIFLFALKLNYDKYFPGLYSDECNWSMTRMFVHKINAPDTDPQSWREHRSEYLEMLKGVYKCPSGGTIELAATGGLPVCSKHGPLEKSKYIERVEWMVGLVEETDPSSRSDGDALFCMAAAYYYGVPSKWQDRPKAVKFARIAADFDYAPALHLLGYSYLEGHGVEQDPARARKYLTQAARQGYSPSKQLLSEIEESSGEASTSSSTEKSGLSTKLEDVKKTFDAGLISQEEYDAVRQRILENL